MDTLTKSVWQTTDRPSCDSLEIGTYDRLSRVNLKLDRQYHLSNE